MLGCWRSERQQPLGNPDRSWGGGWWLRQAQDGPGRYPDSLQEEAQEGGGCLLGSGGRGGKETGLSQAREPVSIWQQEELGPWSSLDEGQRLLPWQRWGAFNV